jgi:Excalibur calcium-binding domain
MLRSGLIMGVAVATALLWLAVLGTNGTARAGESIKYPNCKALNKRYPHGVGRWGARDHTSGTPVTTFKRSNILYRQNRALDRDKDYIACEKR